MGNELERDHYQDGSWYDAEYVHIRADIPYYKEVARASSGKVLEFACGTGRLTIPMAETGTEVVGVDISESMLHRAEQKKAWLSPFVREKLSFAPGDMRSMRLEEKFQTVILGFNSLMHMSQEADLLAVFETAKYHLLPGGEFHLDIYSPYPAPSIRESEGRYDPQEMIDPHTHDRYIVTENNSYDPRTQINTVYFYYQKVDRERKPIGDEMKTILKLRVLYPREMDSLIQRSGFEIVGDWDDYQREIPFTAKGGKRVMCLKKPEGDSCE